MNLHMPIIMKSSISRHIFAMLNLSLLLLGTSVVLLASGKFNTGNLNWNWQNHMDLLYGNQTENWSEIIGTPLRAPKIFLNSTGGLMIALASMVILGSLLLRSHSRAASCIYIWYSILLSLVFVSDMAFIFAIAAFFTKANLLMEETVVKSYIFGQYSSTNLINIAWDSAQMFIQCCGYNGGRDYAKNRLFYIRTNRNMTTTAGNFNAAIVPTSCCNTNSLNLMLQGDQSYVTDCMTNASSSYSNYNQGCASKIQPYFMSILAVLFAIGLFLIPFVIGGSVLATNREKLFPKRKNPDNVQSEENEHLKNVTS